MALAFKTLLSLAPLLAVIVSILKAFGFATKSPIRKDPKHGMLNIELKRCALFCAKQVFEERPQPFFCAAADAAR